MQALQASAVKTASLSAGGGRVTEVADPQADTDAANLRTVRSIVQAQVGSFG